LPAKLGHNTTQTVAAASTPNRSGPPSIAASSGTSGTGSTNSSLVETCGNALPPEAEIKIPSVGATPVAVSTKLPAAVVQLTQQGKLKSFRISSILEKLSLSFVSISLFLF